jgi:hypothetical protein
MESEQDLFAYHGLNTENELMTTLGDEIAREIDWSQRPKGSTTTKRRAAFPASRKDCPLTFDGGGLGSTDDKQYPSKGERTQQGLKGFAVALSVRACYCKQPTTMHP